MITCCYKICKPTYITMNIKSYKENNCIVILKPLRNTIILWGTVVDVIAW